MVASDVPVTVGRAGIAADNASNPNAFSTDKSYLTFGDDNATTRIATSVSGIANVTTRMARLWKVQETGLVGSVLIRIPATGITFATSEAAYLIRSTSVSIGAGIGSGDTAVPMTLNGGYYEATVDFSNGDFFTFARGPMAATQPVNFRIYDAEITQGIQDLENTVPVIQNKMTYVRAYPVMASGTTTLPITARLWQVLDGQRVGDPVLPNNPGGQVLAKFNPNRSVLNDAFYFLVPSTWLSGTSLSVAVEINPSDVTGAVSETTTSDNTLTKTVTLTSAPPLRLALYKVRYRWNGDDYIGQIALSTISCCICAAPIRLQRCNTTSAPWT